MKQLNDPRVIVHIVWEPVLASDTAPPIAQTQARIALPGAAQFWDPDRLLSKAMGERPGDRKSITWDWVAIYQAGTRWEGQAHPPKPFYTGRPVVKVIPAFVAALQQLIR